MGRSGRRRFQVEAMPPRNPSVSSLTAARMARHSGHRTERGSCLYPTAAITASWACTRSRVSRCFTSAHPPTLTQTQSGRPTAARSPSCDSQAAAMLPRTFWCKRRIRLLSGSPMRLPENVARFGARPTHSPAHCQTSMRMSRCSGRRTTSWSSWPRRTIGHTCMPWIQREAMRAF